MSVVSITNFLSDVNSPKFSSSWVFKAPKGRNIAGSLSPKILDQIFSNLEVFKPIFDFTPQRKFLRLLRVNRAWHTAALRHLYRTVAVGQEDDDDTRLLLRTLKRRPDIAALVQEARLGLYGYDQLPTKQHAKIINLCPNLTGLQVWGWNGGVLPILVDAIRSKKTLKKLNINRHTIRDTEGDAFCSPRELMEMMKGWPELERLHLHRRALDGLKDKDDDDPETDAPKVFPPETEVTNPKLRYIRFDDSITGFFDVNYFRDLGVIAPAVEHFTAGFFTYDSNQPRMASLKSCLSQWASTLQEVHITHHDNSRDSKPQARASIDDIFGSFSALRVLDIGPHFVLLSTVVEGSAPLEELYYEGDSTATKHLADQLQSPECLPRLRILQLKGHDIPATHRIRQGG